MEAGVRVHREGQLLLDELMAYSERKLVMMVPGVAWWKMTR
jgi:hypothetical protein